MGVAGAAWATDISQLISGVACYVYMNKKYDILKFQKQEKKFKKVYVHCKNYTENKNTVCEKCR